MNNIVIAACILLLVMLFFKVPVYISVLAASAVYFLGNPTTNAMIFAQQTLSGAQGLSLLAIPFFVMAGVFMNYTGVTRRIMDCCSVLTARMPGGLAQVNILLSTLMGGLSGSSLADAAMEAKMLVPPMEAHGFSKSFSTVITAASGMVVPLIPPGTGLIIYACINNISVGKLFVAGIGPGIFLTATLMIFTHFLSKKRGYKPARTTPISVSEKAAAIKPAILPMLLPIIIIGGVRIGIFTATEAGVVMCLYCGLLSVIYREMDFKTFYDLLADTMKSSATILFLIAASSIMSFVMSYTGIPAAISEGLMSVSDNRYVLLLIMNVFLLVMGMFLDLTPAVLIFTPIFLPIARSIGMSDVHFGLMLIMNLGIGSVTPPVGSCLFVGCGVGHVKIEGVTKYIVPIFSAMVVALFIITFIPAIPLIVPYLCKLVPSFWWG